MNVKDFETKYKDKGGMLKLTEMRSLAFSAGYIAEHFNVTTERVKQWMLEFFGSVYDVKDEQAEATKKGMIEFAKNNEISEFRRAFRRTPYYKEVLSELKKKKVYVNIK
jgi:hypothetical protein